MRERPIRALIEAELTPGPIANDQAAIEEDIRAATYFHPSSTCRMGSGPTAVVDPRLRVVGVERLHVADASVMLAALNACCAYQLYRRPIKMSLLCQLQMT